MEPGENELLTARGRKTDGLQSQERQENVQSGRQEETVLQKSCHNLNSPHTLMGVSSTTALGVLLKSNTKPRNSFSLHTGKIIYFKVFYFFDYTTEVVKLFPICVSPFANFSFMCFTHFSTNTFVIFFLISKGYFLGL